MEEKAELWCVVELFGHQKIAGMVTPSTELGVPMVRVDVPEVDGSAGFTKFYGQGAIYAISPCTEEYATLVTAYLKPKPISIYIPETRQLQQPYPDDDYEPE